MKYLRKYSQKIQDALSKINMKYLHPGKLNKLPDDLIIELSSRCTLACKCCPNGASGIRTRPRCDLGTDTFKQICEHIDLPIRNVFLHLHGEPFLNKDICDIITMLKKRGVTSFNIFSNGYLIDTVLLKRVIEQLNGCDFNICFSAEIYDCDTYERIRYPGKWNKIWQSLEAIDATMGELDCSYSINAIIVPQKIKDFSTTIPCVFQRLKHLKKIHLSSAFPWPSLSETGDLAGRLNKRRMICKQITRLPVILSNGEVIMCDSDYNGNSVIGSLKEEPLSKLVNNTKARKFRHNIIMRQAVKNNPCCDCLLDRYISFSRTVRRTFIEKASEEVIENYFHKFYSHFIAEYASESHENTEKNNTLPI